MRPIIHLWLFVLLIKLIISAFLPLFDDESYYWVWSHDLQLSYYDHPPFVSWILWLGHSFEGFFNAVRWPGVLIGHLTSLVWIYIFKDFVKLKDLFFFSILLYCFPFTGPGSFIISPDLPLMFFWSLSTLFFIRLLQKKGTYTPFFLGLTIGLGFISKYVMVLFPLSAMIYLIYSKRLGDLNKRTLAFGLAGSILGISPVLAWNIQNDFVSFQFQLSHGLSAKEWKAYWPLLYLLGQILLLLPIIDIKRMKPKQYRPDQLPFYFLAIVPLLFFLLTSLKGRTEANWPIVAHPTAIALFVFSGVSRKFLVRSCAFYLAFLAFVLWQIFLPSGWDFVEKTKVGEIRRFNDLVPAVKDTNPLFARSYQMASFLTYQLKRPIPKIMGMNRLDYFDFKSSSLPQTSPYFVILDNREGLPLELRKTHKIKNRKPINSKFDMVEVIIK